MSRQVDWLDQLWVVLVRDPERYDFRSASEEPFSLLQLHMARLLSRRQKPNWKWCAIEVLRFSINCLCQRLAVRRNCYRLMSRTLAGPSYTISLVISSLSKLVAYLTTSESDTSAYMSSGLSLTSLKPSARSFGIPTSIPYPYTIVEHQSSRKPLSTPVLCHMRMLSYMDQYQLCAYCDLTTHLAPGLFSNGLNSDCDAD